MDSGLATEAMPDEYVSSLKNFKIPTCECRISQHLPKEGFYLFWVFLPSEKVDYGFRWENQ